MGPSEGGHHYLHCLHHSLASGQATRREHSPDHQQQIGLKQIGLNMVPPIRTRPSFPLSQSLPSASYPFPLEGRQTENQNHRKVTKLITWTTALAQWNYEPCHVGPPKMGGSWWRVLTKRGPLEKGMANHFSILALRTPWTVWKGEKVWHWKMNSPGQYMPNILLEISGEITPERMKRRRQSTATPCRGCDWWWK